ncbi:hypothetical protein [Flavobacterium hydatis]|uniref:Uncharacterized protein n=1 Tax=Flavobacterium hydatis TaxID=991 RepID=A0A086AG28_FLAHY|nr:hypothetical protein [Flavobacterium hydatis]KFF15642.1 hypothetical protein IW20_13290 [Flavobacterium hydatis]OXA86952.1 hypothetical protein B0A62_23115 [Flavobacterium hydatis]
MKEEFITFEKFPNQNSAEKLGEFLNEKKIEYILENNSLSFDPTFANNGFGVEFCIKIKKEDFEKVNELLIENSEDEINKIDKDYYLLTFSNDELIEVITKSDEWNKFDVSLAKKLLKERGIDVSHERIEAIKEQRILELSKPEKSQIGYIILGYILAFLGGFWSIFLGWHLLTYKKTLPNGNRIYAYSENDRKQGNRILITGVVFSILWLLYFILK